MNLPTLQMPERADAVERAFGVALRVFVGVIAFSIAGSLLLKVHPPLISFFGPVYPWLVKTPTWIYMVLLPVLSVLMYVKGLGVPRMAFFVLWGSFVGGMGELLGTSTGIPFGAYTYTGWLGPKILGHVPYFIPFSWFAMSVICFDLAGRLTAGRYERVFTGALFMVLWDVSLDPAMSRAFPFWVYPGGGFFFGMPAMNWVGWFVVSSVLIWGYQVMGGGLGAFSRRAPLMYGLNCLFPLGITLVYGLYPAFFIGLIATAIPILATWRRTDPEFSSDARG